MPFSLPFQKLKHSTSRHCGSPQFIQQGAKDDSLMFCFLKFRHKWSVNVYSLPHFLKAPQGNCDSFPAKRSRTVTCSVTNLVTSKQGNNNNNNNTTWPATPILPVEKEKRGFIWRRPTCVGFQRLHSRRSVNEKNRRRSFLRRCEVFPLEG